MKRKTYDGRDEKKQTADAAIGNSVKRRRFVYTEAEKKHIKMLQQQAQLLKIVLDAEHLSSPWRPDGSLNMAIAMENVDACRDWILKKDELKKYRARVRGSRALLAT